ncbi:alpha/beta fold hydrolase [Mobilicoccus pelagius]|uniref:AB hydrolase-1 domain-containing protein n=1 Tax=Mobilicoccus pelagius NBRC 104925 TaxID=1089455 RepID=H5UNG7_9MICO|nr:alpha/beta hydrolase [Mobilicoccus pelagius]GAB47275.1 hypothetical protein MOPEL_007_00910 [Mobilicoccus pelagius NBRC 104925]
MERLVTCPNGTTLCIDERGDEDGPLVVQLEGHSAQLVSTPESFCDRLAGRGFRIVRVDSRDVGRSSRFDGVEYTLADMVEDVHGLLQTLGRPAVVCGRSMGGAIAQLLALTHPDDVRGLGLFFTFAKETVGPPPAPVTPAPFTDLPTYLDWERRALPTIAGPRFPFSPEYVTWHAETTWRRGVSWAGMERQRRAMGLQDPWADRLGRLDVPVVVVHGTDDPVVPVAAAHRLGEFVSHADVRLVVGLGHQQPEELDDVFVAATRDACRDL